MCTDVRMIGCLLITHLPVKAELFRQPHLTGLPLIVTASVRGRQVVMDASGEAAGVHEGQTVSEALSQCANAATLPVDSAYLSEVNNGLLVALCDAVPQVQPAELGVFYLDLTGMSEMYGGVDGLADTILSSCDGRLTPRLGIGGGKFPAYCAAARAGAGGWLGVPDDVPAWLAPLPVSWLPLGRDAVARLAGFGFATLGDVAALSHESLGEYLGPAGLQAWNLANGVDTDPVVPTVLPETLTEHLEFPFPVDTTFGMKAGISALAERLWKRASLRGRRVGHAAMEGSLLSGGVWRFERALREPATSAETLIRALLAGLGARDALGVGRWPDEALVDLSLTLSDFSPETGHQSAFWSKPPRRVPPDIDGVERLVQMIPGSALPERRWAFASSLSPLSIPSPVRVSCAGDMPRRVGSGRVAGRAVARVLDLWEVDTEWWTNDPVHRRYWRLALADGGLVTVYHDLSTGGWFRQGY